MQVSGQFHEPAALPPPPPTTRYTMDRKLGGPQSRSGRSGQKKNSLPLPVIENRSSSP